MNEAKRAEIKIPKIAGASNLTIGRWFKRVGDPVSIGEPVVEIDTYNRTHELQAPATGILFSVMVKDGGSVEPGTVIGTIDQVLSGVIDRIGDTPPGRARAEGETDMISQNADRRVQASQRQVMQRSEIKLTPVGLAALQAPI
jgi:pyruvate/2-oxoglutarate dehydrogenase complex dihydrolipoamide acyltransferase (E2) component